MGKGDKQQQQKLKTIQKNDTLNDHNPPPPKDNDVNKKTWYIALTIFIGIIAALGGYPGIKDMFQSPDFTFETERVMLGVMPTEGNPTSVLLSGIAINNGSKPLLIKKFALQVIYKGQTYETREYALDSTTKFVGDNFALESGDLSKIDLQRVNKLSPDDPIAGAILFSTTIPHDQLAYAEHSYILTCIDYRNKKYSFRIDPPEKGNDDKYPEYPKTNSKLVPLDSTNSLKGN